MHAILVRFSRVDARKLPTDDFTGQLFAKDAHPSFWRAWPIKILWGTKAPNSAGIFLRDATVAVLPSVTVHAIAYSCDIEFDDDQRNSLHVSGGCAPFITRCAITVETFLFTRVSNSQ